MSRGLYIHIPYCQRKCGYCDFVSYPGKESTMPEYVRAVIREAEFYSGEQVDTVFIGGGTPSHLPDGAIEQLLEGVRKSIEIAPKAEISIEANPNSFSRQKTLEYRRAGINRLSFGLQAVQVALLASIGRLHTYDDFLQALDAACDAGFSNINADLMYSLPGQSVEQARQSAQALCALPVTHVSAYALKLEKGVPMYGMPQPDEETDRAMFYAIKDTLEEAGFARYEISNFAKKGYECQHNLKYWRVQEYIGLGASAHSFYQGERFSNDDGLGRYLAALERGKRAEISRLKADLPFERIMLKTRLLEGMPMEELPQSEGMRKSLEKLQKLGLCELGERLILTEKGLDLQDGVVLELIENLV